ncbi:IS3 family transposase [Paenibacillus sp. RC21]
MIEELRDLHGITRLLAIAGLSRANYYKWRNTHAQRAEAHTRDHEIKEHMVAIHLHTDITYISDGTHFYYLSAIQDLFNNEIVAWQISDRNDVKLVLDTVEQWTRKRDVSEAVLHSDQGFQYTSQAYNTRLEAFSVKGSHSRKATCLDNACIESFFSHLKTEKLYLHQCKSEAEIHQAVEEYIYFYNYQRFQAKLKQRAPIEYRHALAA